MLIKHCNYFTIYMYLKLFCSPWTNSNYIYRDKTGRRKSKIEKDGQRDSVTYIVCRELTLPDTSTKFLNWDLDPNSQTSKRQHHPLVTKRKTAHPHNRKHSPTIFHQSPRILSSLKIPTIEMFILLSDINV